MTGGPVHRRTNVVTETAASSSSSSRARPMPRASAIVVPPEELESLLGLDAEEAARVSTLVQITIEAYLWPAEVPDPLPAPIHVVGLALAARFAGAQLTKAGSITGETIGSYSYRLASPLTFDSVVVVLGELAEELDPWAPMRQKTYTIDTSPHELEAWPADWWQRDLDRIYGASS